MNVRTASLSLALLWTVCFSLAAWLEPRSLAWRGQRAQAATVLQVLLGDGRRMFANHFFTQADVYLHSGYYPSIFDQAKLNCEGHLSGDEAAPGEETQEADTHAEHDHDAEHDFLGKPKDWLDAFGRRFRITEHKHLAGGSTEREILPWLKLSAELDPQRVETYTVAAYWLRTKLGRVDDAQAFLRDGLRANPDSYELLYEMGRLLHENQKDPARARNVWELALRKWEKTEGGKAEPDRHALRDILINLARLEEQEGNTAKAIEYLQRVKPLSPHPEVIQKQIEELRQGTQKPAASRP